MNWLVRKDRDAGKDWRREEKGKTEDELAGWMALPTQWTWVRVNFGVGDGQGGLACCSPWGRKESDTTEQLNWTVAILFITDKKWKATQCLWNDEWVSITCTVGESLATKEVSADARHTAQELRRDEVKWKEASHTSPQSVQFPSIWNVQDRQIHGHRGGCVAARGWTWGREPGALPGSTGFLSGWWKCCKTEKLTVVMVAQLCEYIKNHWIIHFKQANYRVC